MARKTHSNEVRSDPLIDEVSQRREDLLASYGNDIEKFCEALMKLQDKHPEKIKDPREKKGDL